MEQICIVCNHVTTDYVELNDIVVCRECIEQLNELLKEGFWS